MVSSIIRWLFLLSAVNISAACENDDSFTFNLPNGNSGSCIWISRKADPRVEKYCPTVQNGREVSEACPLACDACATDEPTSASFVPTSATDEPTPIVSEDPTPSSGATDEPTPGSAASDEPTPSSGGTDEPTPFVSEEPTPSSGGTDEPTPFVSEEPTPSSGATDGPTPGSAASDEPTPSSGGTDEPTPFVSEEPTPSSGATDEPTPFVSEEPTPSSGGTDEPTPFVSEEPTPSSQGTDEPTPFVSEEPTPSSQGTDEPTPFVSEEPTPFSQGTDEPTPFVSEEPTPFSTATDKPTPFVTDEPTPFTTLSPDSTNAPTPSEFDCTDNGTATTPVNIEILMDYYSDVISWYIYDITDENQPITISSKKYDSKDGYKLFKENECLDPSKCYQFKIDDFYGDGVCCNYGYGYYKISYDNKIIGEGDEWDYYELSIKFGAGCKSSYPSHAPSRSYVPSISQVPSVTLLPSLFPTSKSAQPSLSPIPSEGPSLSTSPSELPTQLPSISLSPSLSPSLSLQPSVAPTGSARPTVPLISPVTPYNKTVDGRQIYPPYTVTLEKTDWNGKINFSPPSCKTNEWGRIRRCALGLPKTINVLPQDISSYIFPGFKVLTELELSPEFESTTKAVAIGDMNEDGILDMVMGFDYNDTYDTPGGVYIWMSQADGSFKFTDTMFPKVIWITSIALGDMNDDGSLDIVVGTRYFQDFVLFNIGKGKMFYNGGGIDGSKFFTTDVAIADMNGDGKLDIIVGNTWNPRTVAVDPQVIYMNNGDTTFTKAVELITDRVTSVAAGDLNNDGKVDVVFTRQKINGNSICIFMNTGNNIFTDSWYGEIDEVMVAKLADMNGDGFIDIVVGGVDQTNKIYENDGNGDYREIILPGGALRTERLALGDLNGDGRVDIFVSNDGGSFSDGSNSDDHILINIGGGNYEKHDLNLPGYVNAVALGDMNNDGYLDIVYGMAIIRRGNSLNGQRDKILTLNPDAKSPEEYRKGLVQKVLPNQKYFDVSSTAMADLNGDGVLDIFMGSNIGTPNLLFLSNREGSYDVQQDSEWLKQTKDKDGRAVAIGDLNNDGILDLVFGFSFGIWYYIGTGNGKFEDLVPIRLKKTEYLTSLALGYVDDDDNVDIVVCNIDEKEQNLILYNDGWNEDEKIIDFLEVDLPSLPGNNESYAVAIGDMDNNGSEDIVFGNYFANEVLLSDGKRGDFKVIQITERSDAEKANVTTSIAVDDLNNDGYLDIVIGYFDNKDAVLLNNRDGSFTPPLYFGPPSSDTTSIATGDFNRDNLTDIVVGYEKLENQLFLNQGDGLFISESIKVDDDTESFPVAIALSDLNGDGVLEIVTLLRGAGSFVTFFSNCPNGGAQPFAGSWCFSCPNYMGRPTFLGHELSSCLECLPDFLQEQGVGEQCSLDRCFLSERKLGNKECVRCGVGTYYDNQLQRVNNDTASWEPERCVSCPAGTYVDSELDAIDKCFKCEAGTAQNKTGQSKCVQCASGTYQPNRGGKTCDLCATGGYCDKFDGCNGGFTPCPAGSYNEEEGKNNATACMKCPMGTFSTEVGAKSSGVCEACPKGSYGDQEGATSCTLCMPGTLQKIENQTKCVNCKAGEYADKEGSFVCIPCAYRLSSDEGSATCSICDDGFYLKDTKVAKENITNYPTQYCLDCPPKGKCERNTTLQNIEIPEKYWRDSLDTSVLYACSKDNCRGSNMDRGRRLDSIESGRYCKEGHTGPLCKWCTQENYYFDTLKLTCTKCPGYVFYMILVPSLVILGMAWYFISRLPVVVKRLEQINIIFSTISAQAKLKILISFYQVVGNLGPVYGVGIDGEVVSWFSFLRLFSLNLDIVVPGACIGSMQLRMLINAAWPFIVVFIGFVIIVGLAILKRRNIPKNTEIADLKTEIWGRTLYFVIVFMYLVLPSISQGVFAALKCESYKTNDELDESNSYLTDDLSIFCKRKGENDPEYDGIKRLFFGFFILWPILIPLVMLVLVWNVRDAVKAKRITPLAEAISFLWRDYSESFFYWEIIDLYRKIILTGMILLVDTNEGNTKVLRLAIAILVSVLYFGFLLRARPYKRSNDLDIAFVSHILLLSLFVVGILLQLCSDGETCMVFVSKGITSLKMTLLAVGLTAVMLIISALFLIVLAVNAITAPTIRLVSSGSKPNLEMSGEHEFHAFLSHIWSTGKDKTHTIVRKTQLLLPGVKIWLDVDNLAQMDQLEISVDASAVFLIFYSKGYFRSKNCRREIYAAVKFQKPIYIIYEGDDFVLDEARDECRKFCTEGFDVVGRVFAMTPILWLGGGGAHYAIEAVKMVSFSILRNLPFYSKRPGELAPGLKVQGELGLVAMTVPVDVFVCAGNVGSRRIVEEARSTIPKQREYIDILDGGSLLDIDETFEEENPLDKKQYLLLYLDEDVFLDDDEEVYEIVRKAIMMNIEVVTVHEQDSALGACAFETFFGQTPSELIEPPFTLYKDIAVPLYPDPEYRKVSIRQLLIKLGAAEVGTENTGSAVQSVTLLLKNSLRNASFRSFRGITKGRSKKTNTSALPRIGEDA